MTELTANQLLRLMRLDLGRNAAFGSGIDGGGAMTKRGIDVQIERVAECEDTPEMATRILRRLRAEIDAQAARIAELKARIAELETALHHLEWSGDDGSCPLCKGRTEHTYDCWLATLLNTERG